jgi:tetratricopeptide (TPR) repeat protein
LALHGRRRRVVRATQLACLLLSLATMLAVVPASARAQRGAGNEPEPRRPRFTVVRDTNSAGAYYYHGLSVIDRNPQEAADAFYWASRLDPEWADPYFARRVALHLTDMRRLGEYVMGEARFRASPERERIDSLGRRALLADPFLYRRLERRLLEKLIDQDIAEFRHAVTSRTGSDPGMPVVNMSPAQIAMHSPRFAGWLSYTDGRFPEALGYFADALKRTPKAYELHAERADVFVLTTQYDSALVELSTMLAQMRTIDEKKLVPFYDSKAFFEYKVGRVHVMRGDLAAARDAYGRALAEDLSFYMAHAALGEIALAQHDTAAALAEFGQAVDLAADEPGLRYAYGVALFSAAKYAAAADQFRKAIALDPYYAKPYFPLGYIMDGTGKDAEALAAYEGFVRHAPAADSVRVAEARQRVTDLRATAANAANAH